MEHWGTPTNAFEVRGPESAGDSRPAMSGEPGDREAVIVFETALAPPLPVVAVASRRFPGLDFDLRYIGDEFPGNGIYHCRAGEVVSAADVPLIQALVMVMEYLWDDEFRHYRADPRPGHIFEDLVTLDGWLGRHRRTARDFLDEEDDGPEAMGEGLAAGGFTFRGSRWPPGEPETPQDD